jgi:hypothetical protein
MFLKGGSPCSFATHVLYVTLQVERVGEVVPILLPRVSPGYKDLALRFIDEVDLDLDSRLLLLHVIRFLAPA